MDLARVFLDLRPNATFAGDMVNFYSLDTVAATYIGTDLPTQQECDDKWAEIQLKAQVPDGVTMRQARLALLASGDLQAVEDYIAVMGGADGESARLEWQFGTVVLRDHPLVLSVLPAIGLTEQNIDDLFISAQQF